MFFKQFLEKVFFLRKTFLISNLYTFILVHFYQSPKKCVSGIKAWMLLNNAFNRWYDFFFDTPQQNNEFFPRAIVNEKVFFYKFTRFVDLWWSWWVRILSSSCSQKKSYLTYIFWAPFWVHHLKRKVSDVWKRTTKFGWKANANIVVCRTNINILYHLPPKTKQTKKRRQRGNTNNSALPGFLQSDMSI